MQTILTKSLLICALLSQFAFAAEPDPSASPTLGPDDYGRVCGNILATPTPPGAQPDQKRQYCAAAKSAYESAKGSDTLWKAWAAVAGVCVGACALSYAAPIGAAGMMVCSAGAVGASVLNYTVTKDLMSSLTGIAGIAAGAMMGGSRATEEAAKTAGGAEKKAPTKDMGPCIVAATAAYSAYTQHQAMQNQQKIVGTSLQSAAAIAGNGTNVRANNFSNSGTSSGEGGTTVASGYMSPGSLTGTGAAPGAMMSNGMRNCSGMGTGMGTAIMQCALSNDATLPRGIGTPEFSDHFKNNSGIPLEDFMNKANSPRQAIVAAAGGGLNPDQSVQLAAALRKMEDGMSFSTPSSAYASGGGGSLEGSKTDTSMADMMAGFMAQLGPKGEGEDPQRGLKMVIFANQKKPVAVIPEDRTLSIFDRVTFRYHYATVKMMASTEEQR